MPNQQSSGAATNAPNRVTEAEPKTNANITATVVSRQTESQGKRWLRWAGSLKWAVTLLSLYAMVVAWATLVDNEYGATAVAWGIYRSGWFAILNLLLGLNVLCSALVRFPWKRRHIGFLMTHAGILMLLVGSAITWSGGIEGVIGVFEGKTSNHLVTEEKQFAITVESIGDENVPSASMASTGEISPKIAPTKVKNTDQQKPTIRRKVSFTPGPFSWAMLGRGELFGQSEAGHGENGPNEAIPAWAKSATKTPMAMFPWRVSTAAGPSTLYEDDQLCVEVVDWLANVELAPLSPLTITFDLRTADERARSVSLDETLTAEVRLSGNPRAMMRGEGGVPARVPVPNRTAVTSKAAKDAAANATNRNQTMDNGGEGFVTYRVAESSAEATAFSKPLSQSDRESTTFGPQGILQLSVAGESLLFSVDTLTVGQRLPLAQTGLTAIFEGRNTGMDHLRLRIVPNAVETHVESANASTPSSPATESAVNTGPTSEVAVGTAATGHDSHATESEGVTMRLFARYPDFNLNDMTDGVVGYWWVPEVPMGVEDTSHASPGTQNAAEIVRAAQSATEADVSDTANAAKPATATSKPIVPVSAEPFLEFLQYGDLLYARYVRDGWASQVICSSDTSNTSGRSTTLAHQQSEAVSAVMEGVCGEGCWRVDLAKSPLGYAVAPGKMLHAVPFPTTRQTDGTTAGTVEDAPKKATRAEREAWIDGGIRAAKVRV
ncbi:MAG: hypothetical protein PHE53_13890, partial [Thermoguttaceae bacterium]|nr:hypothetical protein [Thermoguttaceae bacterium]